MEARNVDRHQRTVANGCHCRRAGSILHQRHFPEQGTRFSPLDDDIPNHHVRRAADQDIHHIARFTGTEYGLSGRNGCHVGFVAKEFDKIHGVGLI